MRYNVTVTTKTGNAGISTSVEADNPEEAAEALASQDGSTLKQLEDEGLTEWSITPAG